MFEWLEQKKGKLVRRIHSTRTRFTKNLYVGIDGEGQGREDHRYVLLGAASNDGRTWDVQNPRGLDTKVALNFILELPYQARIFAYAFNYDLTMMLKDLPNEHLYYLFRPELRKRSKRGGSLGPHPVHWEGFRLNLQGTKFTVAHGEKEQTIWDIWKFYQASFVKTLKNWNIGAESEQEYIALMKEQRGEFDKKTIEEVKPYCLSECRHLATLAQKLIEAHEAAGIPLTSFYGAGSTGSAILKQMGVKLSIAHPPSELKTIVAASFFGGRFEMSRIGLVDQTIYSYDISSAYPYQEYNLPCLKHARWEHTTKRQNIYMTKGSSLVHYRLRKPNKKKAWGPFPFRLSDGSICFPDTSGGGWVWRDEYLAGEALFDNVEFVEAWNLISECDCHPFKQIPHYYLERIRIGKEGAGWVFKLGPNASYGKVAQSIGEGPFTCWPWAALITSNTRGQLLRLMANASDLSSILMTATDGIHSLERLECEKPCDTGTWHVPKPLGGWEEKIIEGGVFYARPGIYFPLASKPDDVRARGVGRMNLYDTKESIMNAWDSVKDPSAKIVIGNVVRFIGAKTSISFRENNEMFARSLDYGQWKRRPIELSFNPIPKRQAVNVDGSLSLRRFSETLESVPYTRAIMPDTEEYMDNVIPITYDELIEQPDLMMGVYQ